MMMTKERVFFLLQTVLSRAMFSQAKVKSKTDFYKKELQSLQLAIPQNFYNNASVYYTAEEDPAKCEKKDDYLQEYTYIWSLCALYQVANEMEKLNPKAKPSIYHYRLVSHRSIVMVNLSGI